MKFEFIDYSGCFPNLCAGKLTFRADGKQYAGYVDIVSAEMFGLMIAGMSMLKKLFGRMSRDLY